MCAGVLGGTVSLCMGSVQPCAMLVCGGFLAGEIKTRHKSLCTLVMLSGLLWVACGVAMLGVFKKIDAEYNELMAIMKA